MSDPDVDAHGVEEFDPEALDAYQEWLREPVCVDGVKVPRPVKLLAAIYVMNHHEVTSDELREIHLVEMGRLIAEFGDTYV